MHAIEAASPQYANKCQAVSHKMNLRGLVLYSWRYGIKCMEFGRTWKISTRLLRDAGLEFRVSGSLLP